MDALHAGVILLIVFSYVPMIGLILAFKDYSSLEGIFGSRWVGFQWFEEFFPRRFFSERFEIRF